MARQYFNIAALALFAGAVLTVTAFHEPWRDEADVWLMARDNDLASLWHLMSYSGTPMLWHLLVMPLAKLGFPYRTELLLNNLIVIAAAAVLLWRAPFPPLLRLLIVMSYFPAYEYGVTARSYGLSMLLLFSMASLYSRRRHRPIAFGMLIALLANTNAHSLLLATILGMIFLVDIARQRPTSRAAWLGLAVTLLGGVLATLQLLPQPPDSQTSAWVERPALSILTPHILRMTIIPGNLSNMEVVRVGALWLNGTALAALAVIMRRSGRPLFFYLTSLAALGGFFCFVYFADTWHAGLVFLVAIVSLWLWRVEHPAFGSRDPLNWTMAPVLALSCAVTMYCYVQEIARPFSGSRQAARFIIDNGLTDATIAGFPDAIVSAVLPYLPQRQIWYAGLQRYGSHMPWNREMAVNRQLPFEEAFYRIDMAFPDKSNLLLLFNEPLPPLERMGYRLIHQTRGELFRHDDERYYLYVHESFR